MLCVWIQELLWHRYWPCSCGCISGVDSSRNAAMWCVQFWWMQECISQKVWRSYLILQRLSLDRRRKNTKFKVLVWEDSDKYKYNQDTILKWKLPVPLPIKLYSVLHTVVYFLKSQEPVSTYKETISYLIYDVGPTSGPGFTSHSGDTLKGVFRVWEYRNGPWP